MPQNPKRTFHLLLANTLVASITNSFIWFTLTFWVFLETKSVLATAYLGGIFAVLNMVSSLFFGTLVDHNRKKVVMVYSSIASLFFYVLGTLFYFSQAPGAFQSHNAPVLWLMMLILMIGSVAGNLRMIALTTSVSLLFSEGKDKANGMVGAVMGISFALTSVLSGFTMAFYGIATALLIAVVLTTLTLLHLLTISLPEKEILHTKDAPKTMDIKGTIAAISGVAGLFSLIFFTTFNNFLGGVFMALMDAYGLSLLSVASWGVMLSLLSIGFILGGSFIAKFGLGKNPLRRMLIVNVITWTTCIFFTIQPSVILLGVGMLIWMTLVPVIEATEHTVIQQVVPFERQGRVFGFAQSVESAASPITAFLIGPIAQFIFIPFMTTGAGVSLIGDWFGVGPARGIALVFIVAGMIGLVVTLLAFRTSAYRTLSRRLTDSPSPADPLQTSSLVL